VRPYGPFLWEVCDRCNYDGHTCHFCGDNLRHDERNADGTEHGCYADARAEFRRAQEAAA
jgi:hypothetical protein